MVKSKTIFVCQECGTESSKWIGRCPSCNSWNTFVEETKITKGGKSIQRQAVNSRVIKPLKFSEIQSEDYSRLSSQIIEFDRILGGGFVPGAFILLGGEPGIGKSTLALQIALLFENKVLYVSGEESAGQIKMRAERLGKQSDNCLLYPETHLENIIIQIEKERPELVIIDSIQTLFSSTLESAPGSVSQVRECAAGLLKQAKEYGMPIILIGHITKDGSLAGPKVLEHIVDTVVQFEGDQHLNFRMLRTLKNRFGAVPEMAVFEMKASGLKEVLNVSSFFLDHDENNSSGVAITCTLEGIKPMLIEMQALVSSAVYGTPQRSATGFDVRRLNMLLAVLEKKGGMAISSKDIFLNVAGGFKVSDTSADLAVIAAIVSSRTDKTINSKILCCAEISLTGELRPVNRIEQRIEEAKKLGFNRIIISSGHRILKDYTEIEIKKASSLNDALKFIFQY